MKLANALKNTLKQSQLEKPGKPQKKTDPKPEKPNRRTGTTYYAPENADSKNLVPIKSILRAANINNTPCVELHYSDERIKWVPVKNLPAETQKYFGTLHNTGKIKFSCKRPNLRN